MDTNNAADIEATAVIEATALIGVPALPGGGPSVLTGGPPAEYDLKASGLGEFVAGGNYTPLGNYIRTLPAWIDPVQRDFGLDTYQRMVETDPQVASCIEVFRAAVLADGWRIVPAKKGDLEAGRVADFCRDALQGMESTPFDLFLRQMLDACYQGHKTAEVVLKVQAGGAWDGFLTLDRIKPKPHRSTAFVMDAYDNVVGLLGLLPNVPFYGLWPAAGFLAGNGMTFVPGAGRDSLQKNAPALLPRTKFAVLTWDGQDGSPQGRSLLRRAYTPWWWKANGYGIWGKFISKHADPTVIGTAAENAMPVPDPSGALDPKTGLPKVVTPTQAMAQIVLGIQNGYGVGIPPGSKIEALQVANSGEAISLFMDFCNREIAKSILGQTLSTEEGKHASRAQAGVHEHAKDDVTRYGQVLLTRMVIGDVLRLLVRKNFGPGSDGLIPEFGLGQEETMSYADFAAGTSSLATAGYLDPSQYVAMDEMGGLPPRDIKAWNAAIEMKQKQQEQALTLGDKAATATPGDKANEGQAVIQKAE